METYQPGQLVAVVLEILPFFLVLLLLGFGISALVHAVKDRSWIIALFGVVVLFGAAVLFDMALWLRELE